jgi:hypothetical protein
VLLFERTQRRGKLAKKLENLLPFLSISARWSDLQADEARKEILKMQYLLLIYHEEGPWEALSEAERQKIYQEYGELRTDLQKAGKYIGGNQLQPISTATTVRVRNGKASVTDGPFAETKEQLGGYFLVEARDLDDALAMAARIPSAKTGSIEVRPVVMRPAVSAG